MKVYMVYYEDVDIDYCTIFRVVGIYDTEEKADKEVNRLREESNTYYYYYIEMEVK